MRPKETEKRHNRVVRIAGVPDKTLRILPSPQGRANPDSGGRHSGSRKRGLGDAGDIARPLGSRHTRYDVAPRHPNRLGLGSLTP